MPVKHLLYVAQGASTQYDEQMSTARVILKALRLERISRAISAKEAAFRLEIAATTFSRWERGLYKKIDLDRLMRYANLLGRVDLIRGITVPPKKPLLRLRGWKRLRQMVEDPASLARLRDYDLDILEILIARAQDRRQVYMKKERT